MFCSNSILIDHVHQFEGRHFHKVRLAFNFIIFGMTQHVTLLEYLWCTCAYSFFLQDLCSSQKPLNRSTEFLDIAQNSPWICVIKVCCSNGGASCTLVCVVKFCSSG